MKPLVILGPTAAGKSAIALSLAQKWGATLLSMDAMQVYRGMDIGTAKPSKLEQSLVPHRGIDLKNPDEPFNAADFTRLADALVAEGKPLILCGGTTFYFRAWIQGVVPTPPINPGLRAELEKLENPWEELKIIDPILAARLHPNDRVRILRGIEVFKLGGVPLSRLHAEDPKLRKEAEVIWVDREDLEDVIRIRLNTMMQAGYLNEVKALLEAGYGPELKPMQSLGYKHLAEVVLKKSSLEDALERTRIETRQLAKRQRSFLRSWGLSPGADPTSAAKRAFSA
jgi:tRNA dimethylallyltransferase